MMARLAASLPWITAAFCVLMIAPWIVGVPGDPNAAYADGWEFGLVTITAYPFFMIALGIFAAIRRSIGLMPEREIVRPLAGCALTLFVVGQIVAWIMIFT